MQPNEAALAESLAQIGVAITQHPRTGAWGWSITNEMLVQPWVGAFATQGEAISAVLAWLMAKAWKGVLCPYMHVAGLPTTDLPGDDLDEALLAPWVRGCFGGARIL
jgi:hypothetical protein